MKRLLFFSILAISLLLGQVEQGWDDEKFGVPDELSVGGTGSSYVMGAFGLGTANPARNLDVVGLVGNAYARIMAFEAGNALLELYADEGDDNVDKWDLISNVTNNVFQVRNNTSPFLTIETSGDVGIGTANPSFKLDVQGTGGFSDAVTISHTQPSLTFDDSDASRQWELYGVDNDFYLEPQETADGIFFIRSLANVVAFQVETSNANCFVGGNLVVDGGDIGINTDTDLMQLALNLFTVNGDIAATNLTGTLQTAAQTNITSLGTLSALTVSGNGILNSNYFMEGYSTGRNVDRSMRITVRDGGTPGTDLACSSVAATPFNAPSSTNAADLAKTETEGSWSLSADGTELTLNLTEAVIGIMSVSVVGNTLANGAGNVYDINPTVSGGDLLLKIRLIGALTAIDWTTITATAADVIQFYIAFKTST